MRLSLRARFALLAAALVVAVGSLSGLAGYLAFRASVLSHAAATAGVRRTGSSGSWPGAAATPARAST